jgi:serine protease Do
MLKRFLNYVAYGGAVAIALIACSFSLLSIDVQAATKSAPSEDLTTAIIRVAQRTIPAVVHIEVTQRQEVANPFLPFENDPFFRYYFGIPKDMPKKFKRELRGLGSGMITDSRGYILTNYHVVAGANNIRVLLANGERYSAKVVGTDQKTDLAVIKISPKGSLPFVTFGDSDRVKVGEWVVAIGHPRGLDQTVTQGVISAKHRTGITEPSTYQDFLQTDAAINPGNSGGPLLNLRGEVIGVNAVIVSQSGGFEGIGFAIPSNMALYITRQLIAHGKIERGWLGVTVQDLTPELGKSFNAQGTKGALIAEVVKGGPAEEAGLKRGDVVIAYQGREITDSSTLRNAVAASTIGQEVTVSVLRNGKKEEFRVKIGNLEDATKLLSVSAKERLGGECRAITAKEAAKYGLDAGQGVIIVEVDPTGPLGEAGFEVGDIIVEINGQSIYGLEGLINSVNTVKAGQKIAVLALDHRSGNAGYVEVVTR